MAYWEKSAIFAVEMDLERHIEILLLDNDCVIVPGLGGFIAYHTDARYDAESALFLPPTRIAGFNPKLSMNDNLLAQSYVEAYDLSYPEAVKRIAAEADELKSELERNGYYEITGVGTLRVNNEGGYDFEPFEAGLLTPDFYGLGCFEAVSLVNESLQKAAEETTAQENEDSGRFVKIKISTIRNVAAAAVAIFAFFLLSSPLGNTEKNMASVASIQNSVFHKMMPQEFSTESVPETKVVAAAAEKKQEAEAPAEEKQAVRDTVKVLKTTAEAPAVAEVKPEPVKKEEIKQPVEKKAESYYCIVLASALSKSNAENFVEKLSAECNQGIHAVECSNGMKVVYGNFASEKEARSSLDSMRSSEKFKDAWVYKVRAK